MSGSSTMPGIVRELIAEGTRRLEHQGMTNARHEAEWLLSQLLGTRRTALYLDAEAVPDETAEQFYAQIDARGRGTPLQYLLGDAEFFGQRFSVAPGVFIPRPETETVVEAALEVLRRRAAVAGKPLRLLEFGTGSGCIAVTLVRALATCVVVGIELSWKALWTTKVNAERLGCLTRVLLVQGDWGTGIHGTFDGIISNPPYVPTAQVDQLPCDVRQEPRVSLDGGPAGMRDLFQLVLQAERLLAPGGMLALECGEEQAEALLRHVRIQPWAGSARIIDDLAGRPRGVLSLRKDSL
ncbi:MAG: peptide chain release factor N(5)-glutamine methyltransferase [Candidatus Omnitrophota bacterium]|nr:peptide chain release factor N(5)-glutamine methyltransferase [Candidatus Omnitrophota bacterium]